MSDDTFDKYRECEAEQRIDLALEASRACRVKSEAIRVTLEAAQKHADNALKSAAAIERRLGQYDLSDSPDARTVAGPHWLRLISQLDQAEAAACDVLRADAGESVDRLAEVLGMHLQNMDAAIANLRTQAERE